MLEHQFALPSQTTFVALGLFIYEDVYNDNYYPEFDGHFADAVFVEIVPEPATLILFALGAMMLRKKL